MQWTGSPSPSAGAARGSGTAEISGRLSASTRSALPTYGLFIPVGYPTPEQRRLGYTGTAVGIHGPARPARWLGGLNTFWDWTAGCVVVGSDAEIRRIAGWVASRAPARVRIR